MDFQTEQLLALLEECIAEDDFYVLCNAMDSYWGRQLNPQVLQSILFRMCACGAENCLRLFLESKKLAAVLNTPDRDGDRAVHKAARHSHGKVCWLLVNHEGVDVHLRNHKFDTALDIACREGHLHLIPPLTKEIREQGSLQRLTDSQKYYMYTALTKATEALQEDIVEELISLGVDVNLNMDDEVGAALHCAVVAGSEACVRKLLRHGADIDLLRMSVLETPLMCAAECGQGSIAQILIDKGASIDLQTERCSSALTVACHFGHAAVAEVLLAAGADPCLRNVWGFSALYMSTDSVPLLARLLQEEVDVNEQCGEREEVPLHLAAVIGSHEAGSMLIDAGADVEIVTRFAETALWLAVWKGFADFVRLLLQHNCSLDAHSNGCQVYVWEYNCLELALGLERLDLADLLYAGGCITRNTCSNTRPSIDLPPAGANPAGRGVDNESSADRGTLGNVNNASQEDSDQSLVSQQPLPVVLRLRAEILDQVKTNQDMRNWAAKRYKNPRNLLNLSCICIRRNLPHSLPFVGAVSLLPLPPALREKVRHIWLSI